MEDNPEEAMPPQGDEAMLLPHQLTGEAMPLSAGEAVPLPGEEAVPLPSGEAMPLAPTREAMPSRDSCLI